MKPILISASLFFAISAGIFTSTDLIAGETINPVPVKKILLSPDDYDGKSVKVSGQVRSITSERGKRGSEFLSIVIEGVQTQSDDSSETLTVFIYYAPKIRKGSSVIISGTYHKSGHWGGSEREHFIEATRITPVEIN